MANRTKFTRSREKKFLKVLAETANVSAACKAISFSRRGMYDRKTSDPELSKKWDEAVETAVDKLELEIRRRALHGTRKGVYWKGERVATEREYSDALAMFILKGHRPETYRERFEHSGPGGKPLTTATVIVIPDNGRGDRAQSPAGPAAPVP